MRFSSLCVALATLCAAHAITLPAFDRQTMPDDAIGVFNISQFLGGEGSACPFRISHSETINEDSEIPHTAMAIGPNVCTDDGAMPVYTEPALALNAVQNPSSRALITLFAESGVSALYGVENSVRQCGARSLPPGTVVIIFQPATNVIIGFDQFFENRRYMFVDDPTVPGICRYTAFRRPAEEPVESPDDMDVLPTPSPAPAEPVDTPAPPAEPVDTPAPGDGVGVTPVVPGGGTDPAVTDVPVVDPIVTEEEEPSETPDDDPICFPADGSVQLQDGSVKRMDQLELGDSVLVGHKQFSEVFLFSHRLADVQNSFVSMELENGRRLEATVGHYVYANGRLVAARTVKAGDVMELDNGERAAVRRVSMVSKKGLFNPQTMHGDIVVNGVRASTFTQSVPVCTAAALMAPLRLVYALFGWSAAFLDNGLASVANALPQGARAL